MGSKGKTLVLVIALGQRETDNIIRMITITGYSNVVVDNNVLEVGPKKSVHNKQLITLTLITLSGFYFFFILYFFVKI